MNNFITQKYGQFDLSQIENYKTKMQKKIFWLILYTDEKTNSEYTNVDVVVYHENLLKQLSGLNSLLFYPSDLIEILCVLEAALLLLKDTTNFEFKAYRKLILDAGAMIKRLKVGD